MFVSHALAGCCLYRGTAELSSERQAMIGFAKILGSGIVKDEYRQRSRVACRVGPCHGL